MRVVPLLVLYFFFASVAAQCAFPLTGAGECSGLYSAIKVAVEGDLLVEVRIEEHDSTDTTFSYDLGENILERSVDGSFLIRAPRVAEHYSAASSRGFALSFLFSFALSVCSYTKLVLTSEAAFPVQAATNPVVTIYIPAGSNLQLQFTPPENFVVSLGENVQGKFTLAPCGLIGDDCSQLSSEVTCPTGTFVDRTETYAKCTACTAVAHSASLPTCTTATNSQVTACLPGFFLIGTGVADVCQACGNGNATYTCLSGQFKNGDLCSGTSSTDTQTCKACTACADGTYVSAPCTGSNDTTCTRCTAVENCASTVTCTSATNSACTACSIGYYRDLAMPATRCKACSFGGPNFVCTGSLKSAACTGSTTTDDQVCYPCREPCPSGFVETTACNLATNTNRVCTACIANCAVCATGAGLSACVTCHAGYSYSATARACIPCPACAEGTFPSATPCVCTACPTNCVSCTSATTCTACKLGFSGPDCATQCVAATIPNCVGGISCTGDVPRCTEGCRDTFRLVVGVDGAADSCTSCTVANCAACSSDGQCDRCAAGFYYTTTVGAAPACVACTPATCAANEFLAKPCTPTSDHLCLTCKVCPAGTYQISACTTSQDTVCAPCSTCPEGTYQAKTCQQDANPSQNTVCAPCVVVCKPDEWLDGSCAPGGSGTVVGTCRACTTTPCPDGTYAVPCSATADKQCLPCLTDCPANTYRITACQEGGETHNAVCAACSTCSGTEFLSKECQHAGDWTANRVCTACTTCAAETYQTAACTASTDTVCAGCTICSDTEYVAGDCQAGGVVTQDRLCATCTPATCAAGFYYINYCRQPTVYDNVQCGTCSTTCAAETYKTADCSATTNTICSPCTVCTATQFETTPCQNGGDWTINRVCGNCLPENAANCGAGQYTSSACVPSTQTPTTCAACSTTCAAGQYISTACQPGDALTAGSDRICTDCGNGVSVYTCVGGFKTGTACDGTGNEDTQVCQACKTCTVTEYETEPCSETADRVCASCNSNTCASNLAPTGTQYLTGTCTAGSDTSACNSCTVCKPPTAVKTTGERETLACSQTADATCTPCTECSATQYEVQGCQADGDVTVDRVCASCTTTACPAGSYESAPCSDRADRVCSPCSTCAGGTVVTACTATTNTVCGTCASCELSNGEYYSIACGGNNMGTCTGCTQPTGTKAGGTCVACPGNICQECKAGYYRHAIGTDVYDCVPCTVCATGNYETTACSQTVAEQDRVCAACDICPSGTVIVEECSPTQNRVCGGNCLVHMCAKCTTSTSCDECATDHYYSTSTGSNLCLPCIDECPEGFFTSTPCTPTSNRVCTACIQNCAKCTAVGEACVTCNNRYYLTPQSTCSPCPAHCTSCGLREDGTTQCYACDPGYTLDLGTSLCISCPDDCGGACASVSPAGGPVTCCDSGCSSCGSTGSCG